MCFRIPARAAYIGHTWVNRVLAGDHEELFTDRDLASIYTSACTVSCHPTLIDLFGLTHISSAVATSPPPLTPRHIASQGANCY